MLDWLATAMVRLDSFFKYFTGNSHQLAAIQQLQEELPPHLLDHKATWVELWKAGGKYTYLPTPYYHQLDLIDGIDKCVTAAVAMVAGHYVLVTSGQEYDKVRSRFGPSQELWVHVRALESLGIKSEFIQDGTADLIEAEIDAGRPVAVGWLHKGDISTGSPAEGFGHWSVIVGYTEQYFIVNDPRGRYNMKTGKLESESGFNVKYERQDFLHRWEADGPGTGWALLVDDLSL